MEGLIQAFIFFFRPLFFLYYKMDICNMFGTEFHEDAIVNNVDMVNWSTFTKFTDDQG